MKYKVASVQLRIEDNVEKNVKKAKDLILEAIKNGAELIVLPELFPFGILKRGSDALNAFKKTEEILNDFLSIVKRYNNIHIICGLLSKDDDNNLFNSIFLINHKAFRECYRKIHLFKPFKEDTIFKPGHKARTITLPMKEGNLAIGPLICFDIRFPELSRHYCFNGAEVLVVSSLWPMSRKENFKCLIRARAMESQCFLIASNAWGKCRDVEFAGCSSIIAPDGSILDSMENKEGILVATLNIEQLYLTRSFFNSSRPPGSWYFDQERKTLTLLDLVRCTEERKRAGQKMVFTNGCFDILHAGHVSYLKKARSFGDFLVVGLNSDESIKRIKGEKRPINSQKDRALVLSALSFVDYVVIFDEDTPERLIKALKPDVLVKGADWKEDEIVGADFVKSNGGEVKRVAFEVNISTTKILSKILNKLV